MGIVSEGLDDAGVCLHLQVLMVPIVNYDFQVVASPWSVMRFLGENFGYNLPSMPMIGTKKSSNN